MIINTNYFVERIVDSELDLSDVPDDELVGVVQGLKGRVQDIKDKVAEHAAVEGLGAAMAGVLTVASVAMFVTGLLTHTTGLEYAGAGLGLFFGGLTYLFYRLKRNAENRPDMIQEQIRLLESLKGKEVSEIAAGHALSARCAKLAGLFASVLALGFIAITIYGGVTHQYGNYAAMIGVGVIGGLIPTFYSEWKNEIEKARLAAAYEASHGK